jgi:hypothetical protein
MKNIFFLIIIFISTVIGLSSCSLEDEGMFAAKDQFIQSEGYLPLGSGNKWVYETWSANLNEENGMYEYEGLPTLTQNSINSLQSIELNGSKNQVKFGFSPFGSSILGGLLGNYSQVTKIGNKYYRNAKISTDTEAGFEFDLDGSLFLTDSAAVGQLLHSHSDSIKTNTIAPVTIKYGYKTYVTGKYDKLPKHLTSSPGIDDHLAEYTDIIKVTDSLTIEKFQLNINSVLVDLNMNSFSTGSSAINNIGQGITYGQLDVVFNAALVGVIPLSTFGIPIPFPLSPTPREEGLTLSFTVENENCRMQTIIAFKDSFTYKYDLISNDTPIYIDSYYAKGIGKIKTVTNINQVQAVLGVSEKNDTDNGILKLETRSVPADKDPNCAGTSGKSQLKLDLNAILNETVISIPIAGGIKKDLIQNLKYTSKRKN